MSRRAAYLAVVIACVAVSATTVYADADLARINAALDNSDYPAAQDLVTKALASGGNAPETTAELYRLQGVIEGSLGNAPRATEAFTRALALSPKVALAAGMSPKVTKPFEAAKAFYQTNQPLKVKVDTRATPPAVTLVVQSDPMKMIARARVAVVVDGQPEQMVDGIGTIALPAGARLDVRVTVLDANDNRLVEIGSTDVPIVIVSSSPTVRPADDKKPVPEKPVARGPVRERPLYWKWWLWGGGAVAFAGVGTGFGIGALQSKSELEAMNARSTAYTFDQARAMEDKIRTRLLVTNISYGVAIACGVTAAILFLTEPSAKERSTISISPAPTRGGGAIVLGGEF